MNRLAPITLDDELAVLVSQHIREGGFADAGEVVRAGLRLLAEEERRMAALAQAIAEGEASGDPQPFDIEEFLAARG